MRPLLHQRHHRQTEGVVLAHKWSRRKRSACADSEGVNCCAERWALHGIAAMPSDRFARVLWCGSTFMYGKVQAVVILALPLVSLLRAMLAPGNLQLRLV